MRINVKKIMYELGKNYSIYKKSLHMSFYSKSLKFSKCYTIINWNEIYEHKHCHYTNNKFLEEINFSKMLLNLLELYETNRKDVNYCSQHNANIFFNFRSIVKKLPIYPFSKNQINFWKVIKLLTKFIVLNISMATAQLCNFL